MTTTMMMMMKMAIKWPREYAREQTEKKKALIVYNNT